MNSWLDLTQTIANDTSDSIQKLGDVNHTFVNEFTSIQTELYNSFLAENTRQTQLASECKSPLELAQLQNQALTAKLTAGVKAFSQFLSIAGNYRNTTHHKAADYVLSLGGGNKG